MIISLALYSGFIPLIDSNDRLLRDTWIKIIIRYNFDRYISRYSELEHLFRDITINWQIWFQFFDLLQQSR